jgi:hypothetical protein
MAGRTSAIFAPMTVEEFDDTIIIFLILSIIALLSITLIEKPEKQHFILHPHHHENIEKSGSKYTDKQLARDDKVLGVRIALAIDMEI